MRFGQIGWKGVGTAVRVARPIAGAARPAWAEAKTHPRAGLQSGLERHQPTCCTLAQSGSLAHVCPGGGGATSLTKPRGTIVAVCIKETPI